MKVSLAFALLSTIVSSTQMSACSADCESDHDDTLLLQTKAATNTMTKGAKQTRRVHRYRVDMQDGAVSMLQGSHTTESEVYRICADDGAGAGAEHDDDFGNQLDSCAPMTITNEAGDVVAGGVNACAQLSVAEGDCFVFLQRPLQQVSTLQQVSRHGEDAPGQLVTLDVHADDSGDVFLIEIPAMDEASFIKAMHEVKKTTEVPGAPSIVLFQGKGAKQANIFIGATLTGIFTFSNWLAGIFCSLFGDC